jgi:hypothetical protein
MPPGMMQQMMPLVNNLDTLPRDPEWFGEARALIRALLYGRGLSTRGRENIHELLTHLDALGELDPAIDAHTISRYRSAAEHLMLGNKLNYYDQKMLEELCDLLATAQGLKTKYTLSAEQDETDPNIVNVHVDVQSDFQAAAVKVKFEVIPPEEPAEGLLDHDDTVFVQTVMKQAASALQQDMVRRITMKREKDQMELAKAIGLQQDQMRTRATAYRAGLFGSGIGGLKAAYGPMIATETA